MCLCVYNKGGLPFPAKDVISSVEVKPNVQVNCNFLCYEEQKCVGFNFRHITKAENCQLLNSAKGRTSTGGGDWTTFVNVDAVCISTSFLLQLVCLYTVSKTEPEASNCFNDFSDTF